MVICSYNRVFPLGTCVCSYYPGFSNHEGSFIYQGKLITPLSNNGVRFDKLKLKLWIITRSLSLVSKTVFFDINSRFYVDSDLRVPYFGTLCSKPKVLCI